MVYGESGPGSGSGKKNKSSSKNGHYDNNGQKTVRDIALGIPMTDLEYRERKLQAKRPSKEEAKIIPDQDSSQEEG